MTAILFLIVSQDNTVSLLSIGDWFKNLITVNENDKNIQHSKLDDVDVNRNRTCDLTYSDYENKKGVNFSTNRKITVAEKSKLDIRLDFKQYDFNETLSFPFPFLKIIKEINAIKFILQPAVIRNNSAP